MHIPKILISMPSCGTQRTETTVSLARTMLATPDILFDFDTPNTCYIHENREQSAMKAVVNKADYLFFIDSDIVYPPDGLLKLLALDKDIVGGNYNMKIREKKSTVVMLDDSTYVHEDGNKPFECRALPGGFLLIKVSALKKIRRPWFYFRPSCHPKGMIGEDIWFCDAARREGLQVWCDPTIQIDHIGTGVF